MLRTVVDLQHSCAVRLAGHNAEVCTGIAADKQRRGVVMRSIEFDIRIQSEAAALEEGVPLLQGTAAVDPFSGYLDLLAGGQRLHQRSAAAHRNKVLILQHLAEVLILGVLHRSAHHLGSLCSGLLGRRLFRRGGGAAQPPVPQPGRGSA